MKTVLVDTTVMLKAVAHPTDSRPLERSREHQVKAASECGLTLRQNDNREAPRLVLQIGRYTHTRPFKRMNKALRTLLEALEQAAILSNTAIQTVVVDHGYRGVEVPGTRILRSGQRRGVTKGLKAMIKRRSAIEPMIGHMKSGGKLGRNWLKGRLGDALHAILCGAGHNIRLLLRRLRHFYAYLLLLMVSIIGDSHPCAA